MFAKHNPNDIPPSMRDTYNKLTLLANRKNRKPEIEKIFANIIFMVFECQVYTKSWFSQVEILCQTLAKLPISK